MYSMNNNCFNTIYIIVIAKVLRNKRISRTIQFMFFEKSGVCHSLQVQYARKYCSLKLLHILNRKRIG